MVHPNSQIIINIFAGLSFCINSQRQVVTAQQCITHKHRWWNMTVVTGRELAPATSWTNHRTEDPFTVNCFLGLYWSILIMSTLLTDGEITFWVISQPNNDWFCFNMGHFVAAVRVTVGYSDTFADPQGCHCNRRPLYRVGWLIWKCYARALEGRCLVVAPLLWNKCTERASNTLVLMMCVVRAAPLLCYIALLRTLYASASLKNVQVRHHSICQVGRVCPFLFH